MLDQNISLLKQADKDYYRLIIKPSKRSDRTPQSERSELERSHCLCPVWRRPAVHGYITGDAHGRPRARLPLITQPVTLRRHELCREAGASLPALWGYIAGFVSGLFGAGSWPDIRLGSHPQLLGRAALACCLWPGPIYGGLVKYVQTAWRVQNAILEDQVKTRQPWWQR